MNRWLEQHRSSIFVTLLNVALLGIVVVFLRKPAPPPLEIITPEANPTATPIAETAQPTPGVIAPTATPKPLRVYVSGAVATPDVYRLPPGSLIKDAIVLAGGALPEADLALINLAQELSDQQQIYVPRRDGQNPLPSVSGGIKKASGATPVPPASAPAMGQLININTATLEELETLPRVGPVIAQRIIDYREEQGPFATVDEIMNVRGIGPVTFEGLKDSIVLGP
ncbi:MAG: helix-hairpin-helix domain-containing protein [Anaerolineae bacterium]